MKRILLLAAGALGTAGMIALAAPASADAAADPARRARQQRGRQHVPVRQLRRHAELPADPASRVSHPGVLNQFDFFRENLAGQAEKFEASIDRFVKGIPAPPAPPAAVDTK